MRRDAERVLCVCSMLYVAVLHLRSTKMCACWGMQARDAVTAWQVGVVPWREGGREGEAPLRDDIAWGQGSPLRAKKAGDTVYTMSPGGTGWYMPVGGGPWLRIL